VLAAAGMHAADNSAVFLGHLPGRRSARGIRDIKPGTLLVIDEASMMSIPDLLEIVRHAAGRGAKVLIAGDHEQLTAVESGGGMTLLARRLGYVQLAEAVRFTNRWEQGTSLRLRTGDPSALDDYREHGRLRGAAPEAALDDAARRYVANYLGGRDVLLMICDRARCREVSRRIRDDLIHLSLVDAGPSVALADGARASVGDLIICRHNDHTVDAGEPGRTLANGDLLRIEAIRGRSLLVRRALDCDPVTGERRWTSRAFEYRDYRTADLGYAVTGHSAQGRSVQAGIAVVTGTEDRQWVYVAMTRGAESNTMIVFTQPGRVAEPQAGTRPAPELERQARIARERAGLQAAERRCRPSRREARAEGSDRGRRRRP
jgi:AAA domain